MKELTIKAVVDNLDLVLGFVDEILEENDCPMKVQMQIDIAVEEIYVNIANYAYAPMTGETTIQMEVNDNQIAVITFYDTGIPYDPLKKPDPDISLPVEEREIGGLGIFMVKKSMDDMRYEYRNGQNILTIEKKFGEETE